MTAEHVAHGRVPTPARGFVESGSAARVLQALYDAGPSSRADLSRATGLSRGSLTGIVQRMMDRGILEEGAQRASSAVGGKPSKPVWFSSSGPVIAAAHLLPDSLSVALVSLSGRVLDRRDVTIDTQTEAASEQVSSQIAECLTELRAAAASPVLGIGIAVGGMVDTDRGRVVKINLARAFDDSPLGPMVEQATGLTTVLDLHPRSQALGDRWFGLGRGRSSFASIYASEALGVGLFLNDAIQRGLAGSGGEAGHTIVQVDGDLCICGQRGCWETIASERWLTQQAEGRGISTDGSEIVARLTTLAREGSDRAAELLDLYARNLSVGIVNLHQILAPGLFILHGSVLAGGPSLLERIREHVALRTPYHPSSVPTIIYSDNRDSSTLLGAAALVLSTIIA